MYSQFTYVCDKFFPGYLKHALYLHSKFACVPPELMILDPLILGNSPTNSWSSLVPRPWVAARRCHTAVTQLCPVSSACSLGHHWIPAQKKGHSLCPFFSSISDNSHWPLSTPGASSSSQMLTLWQFSFKQVGKMLLLQIQSMAPSYWGSLKLRNRYLSKFLTTGSRRYKGFSWPWFFSRADTGMVFSQEKYINLNNDSM